MQTKMFPTAFNQQSDNIANSQINEAKQNYYGTKNSLNRSRMKNPKLGDYAYSGALFGLSAGFLGCWGVCIGIGIHSYSWGEPIGSALLTWIVVFVVSVVLSVFIWMLVKLFYSSSSSILDTKISDAENKMNHIISKIQSQAESDQQNYLAAFEKNAQEMSVKLAESQLAKRVIEWMTDGFCRTIDAADRRKHIEQINVPFRFEVYTNKITCNLGTFDFEIERCRNLSSPLEQTALARAIAAAIQLNITMKYPKDASGTDRTVNYDFSYTDTHPVVTLTYLAPNGNFQAVTDW